MGKNKSLVAVFLLRMLRAMCEKCFLIIFVVKKRFVLAEAGFLPKIKCDFLKTSYHKVRRKVSSFSFFPHPPPPKSQAK